MEVLAGKFVVALLAALLAAVGALIAMQLRAIHRSLAERREEVKELQAKFDGLLEAMPRTYVMRDDYIRVISGFDKKLDLVIEQIGQVGRDLHEHIAQGAV